MPMIDPKTAPTEDFEPMDEDDGPGSSVFLGAAGGLTQFGANLDTLQPGARSSNRHWHENEDEFLYMLSGEAVMVDNHGDHPLKPGDAVAWKAGDPNAHYVQNRSDAPCTYLMVGTRAARDVVHYPDRGETRIREDGAWRLLDRSGAVIAEGRDE